MTTLSHKAPAAARGRAGAGRPFRVALFSTDLAGRNGRTMNIVHSLAGAGYDVTLYASAQALRGCTLPAEVTAVACLPDGIDAEAGSAPAAWPPEVNLEGVDVVHACGQGVLAWVAPRVPEGTRLIYDSPGEVPARLGEPPRGWKARGRAWLNEMRLTLGERRQSGRVDAVLSIGYMFGEFLQRELKLGRVPVVPIYAALPFREEVFPEPPPGLPPGPERAVMLEPDFAALEAPVKALARLRGIELVAVNGRGDLNQCLEWVRESGMEGRFHTVAVPHARLLSVLASFPVGLVLPMDSSRRALHEIPDALFTCIMAGLPVVASALPGVERIVANHNIGTVVDPLDLEQIADSTLRICRDSALRERLAHNLAVVRRKRYSWEAQEERLLALYAQLLSGRGTARAAAGGTATGGVW